MKKFIEELKKHDEIWQSATSNGGSVEFFEKGMTGANEEEKDIIRATNIKYYNSYSKELCGDFVILTFGDTIKASSRIQVDELYNRYCRCGWNGVEAYIMANVMYAVNMNSKTPEVINNLKDYSKMKSKLIVRPINFNLNELELGRCIYRKVGDIALVLYAVVIEQDEVLNTFKIPCDYLDIWGMTSEEVINNAFSNTYEFAEPRLYCNIDDAFKHDSDKGKFMEEKTLEVNPGFTPMITTTKRTNGAIAMFLPDVKEKIYELMKGEYYIAFTSIHEAMIHKVGTIDPKLIKRSIDDVNKHFGMEETLTFNVYRYNAESRNIEVYEL